jgi:hypothetical protein
VDIDVKALMFTLLERQKEYVREDLAEYSCAMVAIFTADNQSYIAFPKFEDEATKIAEYGAIVERAKSENAVLIVTVNHAFSRTGTPTLDLDEYRWGDFNETNAKRCILLTASGPGLKSCSLELRYVIADGGVIFSDSDIFESEVYMLPDWPGVAPTLSS